MLRVTCACCVYVDGCSIEDDIEDDEDDEMPCRRCVHRGTALRATPSHYLSIYLAPSGCRPTRAWASSCSSVTYSLRHASSHKSCLWLLFSNNAEILLSQSHWEANPGESEHIA